MLAREKTGQSVRSAFRWLRDPYGRPFIKDKLVKLWRLSRPSIEPDAVAFRASLTRAMPTLAGLIGAIFAVVVIPTDGGHGFFEASAQVIPVLALALALDALAFGIPRKWAPDTPDARVTEAARWTLERIAIAVFLAGEAVALSRLADWPSTDANHTESTIVVAAALGWGLAEALALAVFGSRRPAINLSFDLQKIPDSDEHLIVIGMGNRFGDRDVRPLMNFVFPNTIEVFATDQFRNPTMPVPTLDAPTELLLAAGRPTPCKYAYEEIDLPEGQSVMRYYRAKLPEKPLEMQLKLTHGQLRGGVLTRAKLS